jgi:casein kinase II subunit beta
MVDGLSENSEYTTIWIESFMTRKCASFFCLVDEGYIGDRFNLTGLANEFSKFNQCIALVLDNLGKFSVTLM